jgi:hypothetical protein
VAGGGIVLELVSTAVVPGARAGEVLRFMLEPTDSAYRSWWPGVHDRFHNTNRSRRSDHVGDRVLMDERVGRRRLDAPALGAVLSGGRST